MDLVAFMTSASRLKEEGKITEAKPLFSGNLLKVNKCKNISHLMPNALANKRKFFWLKGRKICVTN